MNNFKVYSIESIIKYATPQIWERYLIEFCNIIYDSYKSNKPYSEFNIRKFRYDYASNSYNYFIYVYIAESLGYTVYADDEYFMFSWKDPKVEVIPHDISLKLYSLIKEYNCININKCWISFNREKKLLKKAFRFMKHKEAFIKNCIAEKMEIYITFPKKMSKELRLLYTQYFENKGIKVYDSEDPA